MSFPHWFWKFKSTNHQHIAATLSWFIWKTRNQYIFQSTPIKSHIIFRRTILFILERNVSNTLFNADPMFFPPPEVWEPPPMNCFKLNFNGSFYHEPFGAGIGAIIHNESGEMVAAFPGISTTTDPLATELAALLAGLQMCKDLGIFKMIIEGDSLTIVENLKNTGSLGWSLMGIWNRILSLLASFDEWQACFYRQTANSVVDLMPSAVWDLYRREVSI